MGKFEKSEDLTIAEIEERLSLPVSEWPGKCTTISRGVTAAGLVDGTAVFGHYLGPVAPKTLFYVRRRDMGFVQHGWVLLPDGRVLDPTRWVFEGVAPYVFISEGSEYDKCGEYDEGGNQLIAALQSTAPPLFDSKVRIYDILANSVEEQSIRDLIKNMLCLRGYKASLNQLFWLANRPIKEFGSLAFGVYRVLAGFDLVALIPLDNRLRAERLCGYPLVEE